MVENSLNTLVERVKSISSEEVDVKLIKENNRGEAIRQIKSRLILETIAETENIQVSDEEIEQKITEIAHSQKTDPEKFKETLTSQDRLEDLREDLLQDKAMEFLVEEAKITTSKTD
jgi:trigger factor